MNRPVLAAAACACLPSGVQAFLPVAQTPNAENAVVRSLRGADSVASQAAEAPERRVVGTSQLLAGLGAASTLAALRRSRRAAQRRARGGADEPAAEEPAAEEAAAEEPAAPAAFDPATQVGALPPLGFWDPAGYCKNKDEATFRKYRTAELKHGRVAMMASLGFVMQEGLKFPGFENVPSGFGALTTNQGALGFGFLVLVSGFMELAVWREDESKEPGNFGDPFGATLYGPLCYYDVDMRNRELNNGRLAMFTSIGILAAEYVSGKGALGQLGV